jgi:hypothetical protein
LPYFLCSPSATMAAVLDIDVSFGGNEASHIHPERSPRRLAVFAKVGVPALSAA